jgi:hypothetical protein
LSIKFLGAALEWDEGYSPIEVGVSIGIVIAALGVFLGLKAFADRAHAHGHRKDKHTAANREEVF